MKHLYVDFEKLNDPLFCISDMTDSHIQVSVDLMGFLFLGNARFYEGFAL